MTRRTTVAATHVVATKVEEAADVQLAWLQAQPRRGGSPAQVTVRASDQGESLGDPLAAMQ